MKKNSIKSIVNSLSTVLIVLFLLSFSFIAVAPVGANAQTPPASQTTNTTGTSGSLFNYNPGSLIVCGTTATHPCTYKDLVTVVNVGIQFLFSLSIPVVVIMLSYAGFKLMTSGDSEDGRKTAKNLILNVCIGFAVMCAAYAIVYYLTSPFLATGYSVTSF